MSEKNNINDFDLMMKSILDEAQEAVPERVWEGVSAGLDKAAHRKTVVLRWRRAAIGAAAAAAVVAGVFLSYDNGHELVPKSTGGEMIAVVEQEAVENESETLMASADLKSDETAAAEKAHTPEIIEETIIPESAPEAVEVTEIIENETVENESPVSENIITNEEEPASEEKEYFPENWGEEEKSKRRRISFVVSGIAGTNNALSQNRVSPMMRPQATPAPKKSGIEETSVKSSYGIPLSFGAGVKIGLSPRWSIGTGLHYTFLSRQFYGKYTNVSPEGAIEGMTSSDIVNRQHYIGIPVNVFYDIISNDKISFYAYAGGAVEKCVLDSYSLLETSISHKEKVGGVQLSADSGIGVEFMLGRHLGLYIDPSVRYYFKNDQPKSIRTVQPLMLGFELGLRARL